MNDVLVIIKRNLLSPIVVAILVLSSILLFLGEGRDAWFISSIILLNIVLAIIQEIRAKNALKKIELMSAPHARKINKNGSQTNVLYDQLVVGDMVKLKTGDELPADGIIIESDSLEVDESIITGESAHIIKENKSIVLAACAVVAGEAIMEVTEVGSDTKTGKMSSSLKRYEPEQTPIQHKIFQTITVLTYGALGLALLIFVIYAISGQDAVKIFKTIASAAVTVVPEGLLLASSLLLAYGSLKLAKAKVLPQKLAAIEAMALLEVLCIDKTGTLTSDKISFDNVEIISKTELPISDLIGIVALETSGGSKTGEAIIEGIKAPKEYKIIQNLSFSSIRKYSGVRVNLDGSDYSIIMGAPEFMSNIAPLSKPQQKHISSLTSLGKRVLLVAAINDTKMSLKKLDDKSGEAVAVVVLSNKLRDGVKKTISYLQEKNVNIRVISGDNTETVSYVACQAGIKNYESKISGVELSNISDDEWTKTVLETTIFARILPDQKERIVETFKLSGMFTGMVGDGINDALAIKKSDLGIAMFEGAAATRRVADLVLLDNSFNSLPIGMKLGNRIMAAIEMIATLFFHKITYSVVLLISTFVFQVVYPFAPRHITFMNMFLVSMPTLMWTLFTPRPTHRVSPKNFWRDTLWAVMPIAVLSGLAVSVSYVFLSSVHPNDSMGVSTTTVIIATFFGVYLVFLMPKMFNLVNTRESRLAQLLYSLAVVFVVIVSFGVGFIRDFYDFTTPAWHNTLPLLIMIICIALFQKFIADKAGARLRKQ